MEAGSSVRPLRRSCQALPHGKFRSCSSTAGIAGWVQSRQNGHHECVTDERRRGEWREEFRLELHRLGAAVVLVLGAALLMFIAIWLGVPGTLPWLASSAIAIAVGVKWKRRLDAADPRRR